MSLEEDSSKSSGFGEAYATKVLDYSELGDDCHYLTLREADPVKFKSTSRSKTKKKQSSAKKKTLETLKDLEKEKKKLMKALHKNSDSNIEIINLVSDDEDVTEIEICEIQESKPRKQITKEKVSSKQIAQEQSLKETLLLKKRVSKRLSDVIDDSDTPEDLCSHCQKCRQRNKKLRREEYEMDSSDSATSKLKRKRRENMKEIFKRNNANLVKVGKNGESPLKYLQDEPQYKAFHDVEEAFGDFRCRVSRIWNSS